jgi:hypothetical protein
MAIYAANGKSAVRDVNILDAVGLRAKMGMIKLSKFDEIISAQEKSPLDVGVLKVHIPTTMPPNPPVPANFRVKNTWTYKDDAAPGDKNVAKLDADASYGVGMSLRSDAHERDFSFNAVFFDLTNKVAIDVNGNGFSAVDADPARPTQLIPANEPELVAKDFGGLVRFLRFLNDGDQYTAAADKWGVVCDGLSNALAVKTWPLFALSLADPKNPVDVAAFKLYKIFSKLFKPVEKAEAIQAKITAIRKALTDKAAGAGGAAPVPQCGLLATAFRTFVNDPDTTKALSDFPAEQPKSAGVYIMYTSMRAVFV